MLVVRALLLSLVLAAFPVLAQTANDDLFKAVELNDMAAVEAAIKAGARLSATNKNGMTAADLAVDLGHFRIAHTLLAYRNGGSQVGPRVTEKGRQALTTPSNRISPTPTPLGPGQTKPAGPDPRLADIVPPRKPADMPALPAVPEQPARSTAMPQPAPAPAPKTVTAPAPERTAQETDTDTGSHTREDLDRIYRAEEAQGGGFLTSVMNGIHGIVTLGGLFGEEVPQEAPTDLRKKLPSPADRFAAQPPAPESESAAGRMVDRIMGTVSGEKQTENEFGLPTTPILPPLSAPESSGTPAPAATAGMAATPAPLDVPGLAPPASVSASGSTLPPLASPESLPGLDAPGIAPPVETAERTSSAPSLPALGAPDLTAPAVTPPAMPSGGDSVLDIPGLAAPVETPRAAPKKTPSGSSGADIPGLPPGLDLPGLAAPSPSDEVPGIIPPPAASNEPMPALPPGLEPLPGSTTGQLRRPGGLVQPRDTTTLPAPGSDDLRSRLQKLDDLLRRGPGDVTDKYGTGVGGTAPSPRTPTAAPRTPVSPAPTGSQAPLTSAPADRRTDIRDPAEILRRSRESAKERTILEQRNRQPVEKPAVVEPKPGDQSKIETPHALRPPAQVVTKREEPTSRMMERLTGLGEKQYPHEDEYGLPIRRPVPTGAEQPRKDVDVAELPDAQTKKVDDRIFKLARFFRGDQEQEAGMVPPKPVEASPLPRVIDNLIPENDPARGRVVDDRLLDLTGVEKEPPAYRGQPGATPTAGGEELNPNFVDKLNRVLGPSREVRSVEQPMPPPGKSGLRDLDIPADQQVPEVTPKLPDPWTMTIEKNEADGQKRTLGVSAISPKDGSEIKGEKGVVTQMVGRIRELLSGPEAARGPDVAKLDDAERQKTAEDLLSEALRDGAPTALPDQNQWPVTEVDAGNAVPGVPAPPRAGVLSRTSLSDVVLSMGESVTLENTLPPQQEGVDPLNECIKKNRGTTLFCIEPVDWPETLRTDFMVPTILYTGPMAITRYDQGTPSRFHALFDSNKFEDVVAYYQARYGEPTEIWKRSIAPLAKPREDNPTVAWRSRDTKTNIISVLEVRKYDDSRGGFPDTQRGAVMLYHLNAPQIFPQVSSHELMRLRRTR